MLICARTSSSAPYIIQMGLIKHLNHCGVRLIVDLKNFSAIMGLINLHLYTWTKQIFVGCV